MPKLHFHGGRKREKEEEVTLATDQVELSFSWGWAKIVGTYLEKKAFSFCGICLLILTNPMLFSVGEKCPVV